LATAAGWPLWPADQFAVLKEAEASERTLIRQLVAGIGGGQ
jgi:hypothetical protein